MARRWFYIVAVLATAVVILLSLVSTTRWLWVFVVVGPLVLLGMYDATQRTHTILRNFPLIGRIRYVFEAVRPEIQQYFIESNIDAFPIEREYRSIVYQRAKGELETKPFGTQRDVYTVGYEWCAHSMAPREASEHEPRVQIGGPSCSRPYSSSFLNISAMSYGALSNRAVRALNGGAQKGGFAHNTGEGGISPYHLEYGGDLIWQIGTGYFGCRNEDGGFDSERFRTEANRDAVKLIEIKLSQGAKPGHGGVLPAPKVTREIARIRNVPVGKTVFSPPGHKEFDTPAGLLEFIVRLRELASGKPVGIKLCVGRRRDFLALCRAMLDTGVTPDFITVDGGEGGTGAAPLEFSNSLGMPARDAWIFVHNALKGVGLRDRIHVIAAGKILTGFHMARAIALGADSCVSARGMMLSMGCIQALRCNSGHCPTGITTHNPALVRGLDVELKIDRVANFHRATVKALMELVAAMGLDHPDQLGPQHVFRRIDDLTVKSFEQLYEYLEPGQLLTAAGVPEEWRGAWHGSETRSWVSVV